MKLLLQFWPKFIDIGDLNPGILLKMNEVCLSEVLQQIRFEVAGTSLSARYICLITGNLNSLAVLISGGCNVLA